MSSPSVPAPLPTRRLVVIGVVCLAVACALGAWIFSRGNTPFALDRWWNDVLAATAWPVAAWFSQVLNVLGGVYVSTLIIPVALVTWLLVKRRPWAAAYVLAALASSALIVQILKHTFGRARPEEIAVVSDFGSFPSGHVANAATLAFVIAVLVPRAWVYAVGTLWVLLMAFSRTYVHAHWLSDTLGGALVGVGAALLVTAAFARRLPRTAPY